MKPFGAKYGMWWRRKTEDEKQKTESARRRLAKARNGERQGLRTKDRRKDLVIELRLEDTTHLLIGLARCLLALLPLISDPLALLKKASQ